MKMIKRFYSPICSSVYEDASFNYLVDYADINGPAAEVQYAELFGLDAQGQRIFDYQYPTFHCDTAFNSIPLHLENTSFPAVRSRAENFSTRGIVGSNESALGSSLADKGVPGTVADPVLSLFDASGNLIATNDN
jgi:hypothetical protein